MDKLRITTCSLFALTLLGCAADPPGRAVVATGVVAAQILGYGSTVPDNCDLIKAPYDREVCLRRNSEIAAARDQNGGGPRSDAEDFEAYKQRRDQ